MPPEVLNDLLRYARQDERNPSRPYLRQMGQIETLQKVCTITLLFGMIANHLFLCTGSDSMSD